MQWSSMSETEESDKQYNYYQRALSAGAFFDDECDNGIVYCDVCNIETDWLEGSPGNLCDDCFRFCKEEDMLTHVVLWHENYYTQEYGRHVVEEFLSYHPKPKPTSAAPARAAIEIHQCTMEFLDVPDLTQ